ncbi:chaperone protein HchA [marine gamma proteobacterium HTCC2143]|jgi:molecular chaperone Hsp31 and glyoxalase 3|uniref:Chaperone protein HchA n=1 Tax=marine gamma proteobacterium HTCC2143 TaxID=247633 RepID=A0YDI2_9GAMM|nr:chaperone protein HchA [marine gamma proteobacterium HTCC2143]
MLKRLLGIAPNVEPDGSYSPSKLALKLATVKKTDFEEISYPKYQGKKSKVLVICTEQKNMTMKNGTLFSTGNHPVETLLPMLHLHNAGFDFDIATPTGKPAVFEMWAFPDQDEHVKSLYSTHKSSFERPTSLQTFADEALSVSESYAAVFVPGGHGAMLGIPEDKNVQKVLNWAHENALFTITLCHGPAALLATTLDNQNFLYSGYNMAVFPHSVDKMTPKIGYLPGQVPWELSEKLASLDVNIVNTKADNTTCQDRKLITGASPLAANELGKLAAKALLNAVKEQ